MYQTPRAEVMEKGVAIEEGISGILGFILDIEYENSKSLGYKSSALSFNSKVNLLTDLKFVHQQIARKFLLFAEIRNKFAHVQKVDSFTKCFEILHEHKKYFKEQFGKGLPPDTDEEIALQVCFSFLCMELGFWMNLILSRSHHLKSENLKRVAVIEMLRSFFGESTSNSFDNEMFLSQIDLKIKDIEEDKDFMQSVEEARKTGENHSN